MSDRNYDEELARIMDGLAESTLGMSDEEMAEELREEGDAPERVAEEVMGVLRRAVKAHRQRDLLAAQNRDFTELPDAEVTSYLEQLHDLGALVDPAGGEEEGR